LTGSDLKGEECLADLPGQAAPGCLSSPLLAVTVGGRAMLYVLDDYRVL
jgi:hypothetical protein